MDWSNEYDKLIQSTLILNRGVRRSKGFHIHHITPRSLGGSNSKTNLVKLTFKEHYLAHKYLFKMYENHSNRRFRESTALAWILMSKYDNMSPEEYSECMRIKSKVMISYHKNKNIEDKNNTAKKQSVTINNKSKEDREAIGRRISKAKKISYANKTEAEKLKFKQAIREGRAKVSIESEAERRLKISLNQKNFTEDQKLQRRLKFQASMLKNKLKREEDGRRV